MKMNPSQFGEQMRNLAKGNDVNNEKIWRSLEGENTKDNAFLFCLQIFQMLIHSEKKDFVYQNQEKMLATLMFVEYYKNKRDKSSELVENCKKYLDQKKNKIQEHGMLVIQMFLYQIQEMNFLQKLISRYVFAPEKISFQVQPSQQLEAKLEEANRYNGKLNSHQNIKHYSCLRMISFKNKVHKETKILSFTYVCFNHFINEKKNIISKQVYLHLLNLLKFFKQALTKSSSIQPFLVCLLYIVQRAIIFSGCQYPQILKQIAVILKCIDKFPGLVGNFAEQTFSLIYKQLKFPGSAFRKQLKQDFPQLDIDNILPLRKQFYFITNKDDIFSSRSKYSLGTLRKLMIFQIIKSCEFENLQPFKRTLKSLDDNMTYEIYTKISKALELSLKFQQYSKIKKEQKRSIIELFRQLNERLAENSPKIPKKQLSQFEDMINEKNQYGIFEYPLYDIVYLNLDKFLLNYKEETFLKILDLYKISGLNYYKSKIPFVFNGSDFQFNKFINFLCPYMEKTKIQEAKSFKIFYIPRSQLPSTIPKYLSDIDIWYKRFIFWPFKCKMVYPQIDRQLSTNDLFPVYYIYNQMIQIYIKEARRTVPIRVYKCKIQTADSNFSQIYFCCYVALGTSAEAQVIRQQKEQEKFKKYSQIDYIQLLTTKIKKVSSVNLELQMTVVDSMALNEKDRVIIKKENNIKVEDLVICNTPKEYFMGNQPDPLGTNLQVSILNQAYGKVFRKQITDSSNFGKKNTNETIQAFKDLFINFTVQNISIKNKGQQPLSAVIDGVLVHKIEKLSIQPVTTINNIPLTLPIQTFLPFS